MIFISDIHGYASNVKLIEEKILNAKQVIILGDVFYSAYYSEEDINYLKKLFKKIENKLIILKGNCDIDSDFDFLSINIKEIIKLKINNKNIILTHGHLLNEINVVNNIIIYGHYHIPYIENINTNTHICVGSISYPRNQSKPTYLVYENNKFIIYDIFNNKIKEL